MKRMVSIVVGSAALMCGAASVETATFEDIASDAQVVTAVDLSGLASEGAIPVTASQVGVGLTNGVITIDGEAITPLVEHQSLEAYATKAAVADAAEAGTNYVNTSLTNYYKKTETYTKSAVDGAIYNASNAVATAARDKYDLVVYRKNFTINSVTISIWTNGVAASYSPYYGTTDVELYENYYNNYIDDETKTGSVGYDGYFYTESETGVIEWLNHSIQVWLNWSNARPAESWISLTYYQNYTTYDSEGVSTYHDYQWYADTNNGNLTYDTSTGYFTATPVCSSSDEGLPYVTLSGTINWTPYEYDATDNKLITTRDGYATESWVYGKGYITLAGEQDHVFTAWKKSAAIGLGASAYASGTNVMAVGASAYASGTNVMATSYTPDTIFLGSTLGESNTTENAGVSARSLRSYIRYSLETLTTNEFAAADGMMYDLTLDETQVASGVVIGLPPVQAYSQEFGLRLVNPTASAVKLKVCNGVPVPDYPNGTLALVNTIEAGTTNYLTFTQIATDRWALTTKPIQ